MPRWDIFCRVVDNFGDIGVCWRLARQLADEFAISVRLWVDNLDSFARLCPAVSPHAAEQEVGRIEIRHWTSDFPKVDTADVIIEAFACELPETYIAAMAQRTVRPVWINLEYLSAEDWVEDCHLLASPHPKFPLTKHFFFPGLTPKTGGLLKENTLKGRHHNFDSAAAAHFWRSLGIDSPAPDELRVSLFCYENPALPQLLECWADSPEPIHLFTAPGSATEQTAKWLEKKLLPGTQLQKKSLTVHALPFIPQADYDHLLWACDVNFVRGEDSFVRAQWAQRPFVWQIYPQDENAHLIKLEAFLTRYLGKYDDRDIVRRCWQAWNGTGEMGAAWRDFLANRRPIQQHCEAWACQLDRAGNLANNLARFVREK